MKTTIDSLQIKGEPAPKQHEQQGALLNTTMRLNRPATHAPGMERAYQYLVPPGQPMQELTLQGHAHASAPVRKMEHLSRIRTANFGMSTMDSTSNPTHVETETHFIIEKPHFVLCGLPLGSKDIDHHLYVSEARVGGFKTTAKALYQVRNGQRSAGKAFSEPIPAIQSMDQAHMAAAGGEMDDSQTQRTFPPMPPTTPVNYALAFCMKPPTAPGRASRGLGTPRQSVTDSELPPRPANGLYVKQKKMVLHSREEGGDGLAPVSREHSSISTRSGRSIETVKDSVVNNSHTVSTGKRPKLLLGAYVKHGNRTNYNNPYRNTKFKERLALKAEDRVEFNCVDSYLKYQKQQNQNGRHIMTPRAILKIPKPCSDNFLLQMMYELNRPKSRTRSGVSSAKYSDIARTRDLEEFVLERTASSLSKTQSNIDRFMGRKSGKSAKSRSSKSAKSNLDADTIEEEDTWEEVLQDDRSSDGKP